MSPLRSLSRPFAPQWRMVAILAGLLLAAVWLLPHPYLDLNYLSSSSGSSSQKKPSANRHDRPLVLYTYAESDNAKQNLDYFVHKGLHSMADFVFVFNGPTNATDVIPNLPNVRVVQRDNTCFDLGAMGQVLMEGDLWKKYKRFITMNASIRGPFFPVYSQACWTDTFLDRVTDHVKLVGTSMNCVPRPHVQSMLFATDQVGMSILLDPKLATTLNNEDHWGTKDDPVGFSVCFDTLFKAVHSEIGITELIRSQGYEVDVMLTSFSAANSPATYCEENNNPDDVLYDGQYFGTSVHPYETVFIKANRGIAEKTIDVMTKWHMSRPITSWETCR